MQSDYQIRIVSDYGEEEVLNFTSLKDAQAAYDLRLSNYREQSGTIGYEFELLEVIQQDHIPSHPDDEDDLT